MKSFDNGHTDSVFSLTISKDGRILYTGGADCRILAWDTEKGEIIKEF